MFRLECPFKVTVTCLKESRSNFASKINEDEGIKQLYFNKKDDRHEVMKLKMMRT